MADSSLVQREIEVHNCANACETAKPMARQGRSLNAEQRRQELLINLAVNGSAGCPKFEDLPSYFQNDIQALFDTYEQAWADAEQMLLSLNDLSVIPRLCKHCQIGKLLPNALYVHTSALKALDPLLQLYERHASLTIGDLDLCRGDRQSAPTIVKFQTDKPKISYLFYPDFDTDPHPALLQSIQVDMDDRSVKRRDYIDTDNPPILHRKETFVTPDYPLYKEFAELTRLEEANGLLDNSRAIGTLKRWLARLEDYRVEIQGHRLIKGAGSREQGAGNREAEPPYSRYQAQPGNEKTPVPKGRFNPAPGSPLPAPLIERHKAAIARNNLSRPVRLALEAGLFSSGATFFDYGCGYGSDLTHISQQGYTSAGWDPYYSPETPRTSADVVNLGYVINVIEDPGERREALLKAWELTRKVLLVAAQVLIDDRTRGQVAYGDGVITSRNTFQKYYEQEELKIYIDGVLGVDAIPVALGIYFVFRDEASSQIFLCSRFRSRTTTPKVRSSHKRFEDYQELLAPLMAFVTERGRLPVKGELPQSDLSAEFGTLRRAFQVILQATDPQEWEAIAEKRRQDLLVYLALSQLSHHMEDRAKRESRRNFLPKLGSLASVVQEDIKALFGSYKHACMNAERMLFSLGNPDVIAECCKNSQFGKKLSNSLWIHVSAVEALDPLLRLYEGCASRTIGRLEGATAIKFHTKTPKISYLFYPEFDTDPHPVLHTSMQIDLRDLSVSYRDYDPDDDPPVLHQKDALVTQDYPLYEKFAKLSRQESDWGLLDDFRAISHRQGWHRCLEQHCATLQGHRVVWRKDADPYKVKLLRSAMRARGSFC